MPYNFSKIYNITGTIYKYTDFVTTQVPKTTIGGLHYAGTTPDMEDTVTNPGI
jgi:hypothetical protein